MNTQMPRDPYFNPDPDPKPEPFPEWLNAGVGWLIVIFGGIALTFILSVL
jgi:hypothetical protein